MTENFYIRIKIKCNYKLCNIALKIIKKYYQINKLMEIIKITSKINV